jgi:Zn-finger nucleic acid-binding protein
MKCPACQKKLHRFQAAGATLDGCAGCGGIWFDDQELDQVNRAKTVADKNVAEIHRPPAAGADENAVRACPKCKGVTLEKKLFSLGSGVIMDCCPKCRGVWLDFGELEKIHESLHPGPVPRRLVTRESKPVKIPITFALVEQVQQLRRTPRD